MWEVAFCQIEVIWRRHHNCVENSYYLIIMTTHFSNGSCIILAISHIFTVLEERCVLCWLSRFKFHPRKPLHCKPQYKTPQIRVQSWNFNRFMYQLSTKFTWHLLLEFILMYLNSRNNKSHSHHKLKLKIIATLHWGNCCYWIWH